MSWLEAIHPSLRSPPIRAASVLHRAWTDVWRRRRPGGGETAPTVTALAETPSRAAIAWAKATAAAADHVVDETPWRVSVEVTVVSETVT